jgi:dephospho-CoA kinase
MKKELVARIIAAQPSVMKAERLADFIIDNSGSLEQTRRQVERLRRKVWRN